MCNNTAIKNFLSRTDLKPYASNALLLYALEIKCDIDDIHAIASQILTDGSDDKKCDLVYVDKDNGRIIVAQGYYKRNFCTGLAAPSNKAADLNTAVVWLFNMPEDELPERIKPAALEVREALTSDKIEVIEFCYVHNLLESKNVKDELNGVVNSAKNAVKTSFPSSTCNEFKPVEVGTKTLEEWYMALKASILVTDRIEVKTPGGYSLKTLQWEAYATAIPARFLYNLYNKHKTHLFSANIRDFLGIRRSDQNINHNIKKSAAESPEKFWAFNNGITALVNDFDIEELDQQNVKLTLQGISIVNGAQTTGSIGSLDAEPADVAMIPARFIKCTSQDIISEIVRYNNSQNKIAPADFRSTDPVQDRLRVEFHKHPNIIYLGGRRGQDRTRRTQNVLSSDTVAQALASFHQDPDLAYNRKKQIWEMDEKYSRFFNENTHAEHIIFVYSLHKAINFMKVKLMEKESAQIAENEQKILEYLRFRGSIYLLIAAIGSSVEIFLSRPVPDLFCLRFEKQHNMEEYQNNWEPIIKVCVAFRNRLRGPVEKGLKNMSEIKKSIADFKSMVEATAEANSVIYKDFADKVLSSPW